VCSLMLSEVRHTLEVVGKVRRSQAVEAAVYEDCQFVVDLLTDRRRSSKVVRSRHFKRSVYDIDFKPGSFFVNWQVPP